MNLSLKTKTIISITLFILIFGGLLATASFTDLQVSHLLTKNALPDGEYLANDVFGVALEILGSSAVYLVAALCTAIVFWFGIRVANNKYLKIALAVVGAIGTVVAFTLYAKDLLAYTGEHVGGVVGDAVSDMRLGKDTAESVACTCCCVITAILMSVPTIFALKPVKAETLKKLMWFVIAYAVMCAFANLLVLIVKDPVGRMRYRTMNSTAGQSMGGFANYTNWWVATGNNKLYDEAFCISTFGAKDAFKSYPSGHTNAAGMCYALIMLIDVLDIKKTWQKVVVWASTIVCTMLVAISRIVVGAHFFSDVLWGGTIAFLSMIIVREIFICKGSHVKALFGKKEKCCCCHCGCDADEDANVCHCHDNVETEIGEEPCHCQDCIEQREIDENSDGNSPQPDLA